jgi:glycosyltransferase involved in cell wall biosynthesis
MRIGIGALATSNAPGARQSGIHCYAVELVQALPGTLDDDDLVVYSSISWPDGEYHQVAHRGPRLPTSHPAGRVAWERLVLPLHARRDRLDLYHGLAFALPRGLGCPGVVTIHDLAFLKWPEQVPSRRSRYLSRAVRDAAGRAARVIAVSDYTKRETMRLLGVPSGRIDVTPLGVDPRMRRASDAEIRDFRTLRGLAQPFILAVGNLEPRKNLPALVSAFDAVARELPHDLVLAGAEGWKTARTHEAIAASPYRERIRLPGFVPPSDLPLWYSACDIFVMPSLDEGFGLPLVEALACGAPAIAANRGALPEVAGDAALLVEPEPDQLATAIMRLAGDDALREGLREAGPLRAADFTWAKTAELTVASYRKAMQ